MDVIVIRHNGPMSSVQRIERVIEHKGVSHNRRFAGMVCYSGDEDRCLKCDSMGLVGKGEIYHIDRNQWINHKKI